MITICYHTRLRNYLKCSTASSFFIGREPALKERRNRLRNLFTAAVEAATTFLTTIIHKSLSWTYEMVTAKEKRTLAQCRVPHRQ